MDVSLLGEINSVCNEFAIALHQYEFQVYAMLTILLLVGTMLFPTQNSE